MAASIFFMSLNAMFSRPLNTSASLALVGRREFLRCRVFALFFFLFLLLFFLKLRSSISHPVYAGARRQSRRSRGGDCGPALFYATTGCFAWFFTWTLVNQPWRSGAVPFTMPKNSCCRARVTGPVLPLLLAILSIERIGVISEAVPQKKTSSAM